jgi:hypothetical protein
MVHWLSLGFSCSLLLVGCGETSRDRSETAQAGAAGSQSYGEGGGGADSGSAGAASNHCQEVVFEDASVEQAVRTRLGVSDRQPIDGAQSSQLDGILYLEGATSLAGLECCTALTGLVLTGGMLGDVSALAELPKLRNVTFYQTQLGPRALGSLSGAPALRELFFNDIPINDLSAVVQLPALTSLAVNEGQVSDIAPLANTKLESLLLDDSPLANLEPLAALTTLRTLSLARTKVTSVEALTQLSLQELNLDGTLVTSLAPLAGPFSAKDCSHLRAEQTPLTDESWAIDRERLCTLGWAVRASRPGDADAVTCGDWCDIQ